MYQEFEMERTSLESQGVNSKGILNFINLIKERNIKLHTFTLARNGKVICEIKGFPFEHNYRHVINSCTKTFISLAVGICYDMGLINIDDKVSRYFNVNAKKNNLQNLTIRHLLTMSVGHDMEPFTNESKPWAERLFDKPLTYPSGSKFHYNNLASNTLSSIVTAVSGKNVEQLLKESFFDKCGIEDYYWIKDDHNNSLGAAGLYIKPTDLLKLGQLFLNKGILNGHRIVSEKWIDMATAKQIRTDDVYDAKKTESTQGYGFQLWKCTHNGYRASGLFGQVCLVLPDKNIVAVFNSSTSGSQPLLDCFFETIYPYILDEPVKSNYEAVTKIREAEKMLDLKPVVSGSESHYQQIIDGKELKSIETKKKYKFIFGENEDCILKIYDDKKYTIFLGKGKYNKIESDYDHYMAKINPFYKRLANRTTAKKPITYGSYGWISNSHLKAVVVNKDYTAYSYFDFYFDDMYIIVNERIEYNSDGYENLYYDILEMVK
ncbi:MAG: serine hydrolase domain-containing protein [Erysipelotrichaceae bacterium]|jgi:CubicO group peptidase (beta-lactamase class C family)